MAGRLVCGLAVYIALTELVFCEEVGNYRDIETQDENAFPHDFHFQEGVQKDSEISKRRAYQKYKLDKAEQAYAKLETFFRLSELPSKPKHPVSNGRNFSTASSENLDLVFVLDRSGSVGSEDFKVEKTFVESLIENLEISPDKNQVAVVTYSNSEKLEFDFNKYINKGSLRNGIKDIRYTGGMTATGTALQYVRNSLIFNSSAGARSGAKKVVFVLTDGHSNQGITPATPARQLRASGVIIFALGVTTNVRKSELLSIASSWCHELHVDSYATLNKVTKMVKAAASRRKLSSEMMNLYGISEFDPAVLEEQRARNQNCNT